MHETMANENACVATQRNPADVPSLTGYVVSTLSSSATGRMAKAARPASIYEWQSG